MHVLIVESNPEIASEIACNFGKHRIRADTTATGQDALERLNNVDAVLLNPILPDIDGLEACRVIRSISNIPIIVVSEEDDELECILALKLGADDYVARPYRSRELIARVEAAVRRCGGLKRAGEIARKEIRETLRSGCLRIDLRRHRVTVNDTEIYLTCKEFDLLVLLATEPGRVFTSQTIMTRVWGHHDARDTRTLRVHVSLLRKKLRRPELIETIRGVGLRLVAYE